MTTLSSELEFHISGMDCANCARTLEHSIARLEGVESVSVDFSTAMLHARGRLNPDAIRGRVQALGYGVIERTDTPSPPISPDGSRTGVARFIRYLITGRRNVSALAAVVILVLASPLAHFPAIPFAATVLAAAHLAVIVLAGHTIMIKGIRALAFSGQITIDLLMSIATIGALLIGETGEAATVIVLFALGEALEGYTAERARDSLRSLLALAPDQAHVLRPCTDCVEHLGQNGYEGGPCPWCGTHEIVTPVTEVRIGDTVLVRPAERIPVDGRISNGVSSVNQAPITGESIPVHKQPGDEVFAGTINGEAAIEVEVTRLAGDSTIGRIVRLVEQAQAQRSPVERFVDRFARWYTPVVVVIAVLTATVPPLLFGQPFFDTDETRGWLYRALALLIVACPCALVISTPVTMVSSLTALARRGVLVKGGVFLDALARVKTFAFDKTGTLTAGVPVVVSAQSTECSSAQERCESCDDLVALAASVEARSEHPLAHAILLEAEARGVARRYAPASAVRALAGRGVQGILNGDVVTIGSHMHFHESQADCRNLHPSVEEAEASGNTVILVSRNNRILGFVSVADAPRPTSREAIGTLKALDPHTRTVMLTGDNISVAQAVAQKLGQIDEIHAGLLPEDKVSVVRQLQRDYGVVAMIGDGVNDAPALAAATVGIAMGGGGTAQAMETADIVLMQGDLTHLPDVVLTSRRTQQIIWQNIAFSLTVKALFLLLALPGWATLWMAVFADMGASLLVTLNGMRMLRQEPGMAA